MIKLTGLWLNETKDGVKYFAGNLGGGRVLIFKNKHKEEDKHPDYVMYLAEIKKKDDDSGGDPGPDDDDIPF